MRCKSEINKALDHAKFESVKLGERMAKLLRLLELTRRRATDFDSARVEPKASGSRSSHWGKVTVNVNVM